MLIGFLAGIGFVFFSGYVYAGIERITGCIQ